MPDVMRDLARSIKIYYGLLGRWTWALLINGVFAVVAVLSAALGQPVILPAWGWIALTLVGSLTLPFFAFHRLRVRLQSSTDLSGKSIEAAVNALASRQAHNRKLKRQLAKALRSGNELVSKFQNPPKFPSLFERDCQKALGEWVTDTHLSLTTQAGHIVSNRFGDATDVPATTYLHDLKIWDLERFLKDRLKILESMRNDLSR